jgi:HK97 gp10 family phage protein
MSQIVSGMVELTQNLKELAKLVSGEELEHALMQGGFVIEAAAKENVTEQDLIDTGNLRDGITTEAVTHELVEVGPQAEYGAIHEFGGEVHPRVTSKMRGWAFAMFRETGNDMYLGIALTKKETLNITIPARPYMRPAMDENETLVLEKIGQDLERSISRKF